MFSDVTSDITEKVFLNLYQKCEYFNEIDFTKYRSKDGTNPYKLLTGKAFGMSVKFR
jgi:hypothetical protein